MGTSVFGSIGSFLKKSMSAGSTAASALDYGMRTLETQAFMYNIRSQSEALKDANALSILNNYVLSDDDSDNITKFVTAAKLMSQATTQTTNSNPSNFIRR